MRHQKHQAGTIAYLLRLRDGAYAIDKLLELSTDPRRPDLTETERLLVQRADPLSDMAVASYGYDAQAVRVVYDRALAPQHRVSVLSNPFVRASGWAGTVIDLEQAADLLTEADPFQLDGLFSNRRLSPEGLADVLCRRGPAASIPDKAWPNIFLALSDNTAIGELFDTRRVHASGALRAQMHELLFDLMMKLPLQPEIAEPLGQLLCAWNDARSPAATYDSFDMAPLIARWHPNVSCDASGSPLFRVLMLVAILCSSDAVELKLSPFPAVKAAAVAITEIFDISDMKHLVDEDPSAFFAGMPFNRCLYETPLFGTEFVSLASRRDESALALYFDRQALFDQLWRMDRPLVARDLDRIRAAVVAAARPGNLASEESLAQSMQDNLRRFQNDPPRKSSAAAMWRFVAVVGAVIILLLLLLQALEIQHFS